MILCRVILGNIELVLPGSEQFYPSDESFDSGVDNLDNPNQYIVWNMNMNTHIYPEYIVSVNTSPIAKGSSRLCYPFIHIQLHLLLASYSTTLLLLAWKVVGPFIGFEP